MNTIKKYLLSILLVAGLTACESPKDGYKTGEFPPERDAIVYGEITSAGGDPVEHAKIISFHRIDGCESESAGRSQATSTTSDSLGQYSMKFGLFTETQSETSCFLLEVIPEDTTAYKIPPLKEIEGEFELRTEPPYDSVRVDVELEEKE